MSDRAHGEGAGLAARHEAIQVAVRTVGARADYLLPISAGIQAVAQGRGAPWQAFARVVAIHLKAAPAGENPNGARHRPQLALAAPPARCRRRAGGSSR